MSIIINTNIAANSAQRHLSLTSGLLNSATERLSSGLRINHAADDAAGLSITQKLEGQVRGTAQAQRNAQDGISLLQTADGALDEVSTILQRMRELAVQGANDTMTCDDREAIVTELYQLGNELDAISCQTTFNTKLLLDGSFHGSLQVGADCGQILDINLAGSKVDSATLGFGSGGSLVPVSTDINAVWTKLIASVDTAIVSVSTVRATIGADQNRLESIIRRLGVANENMASAESRIKDADMAKESVNFNKALILQQAGIAVLAQANSAPNSVMRLLS
jgi:flagellin